MVVSDTDFMKAYANERVENARLRAEVKELKQGSLLAAERIRCEACGCQSFQQPRYARALPWRKATLRTRCVRCGLRVTFPPGALEIELYDTYNRYYAFRWLA